MDQIPWVVLRGAELPGELRKRDKTRGRGAGDGVLRSTSICNVGCGKGKVGEDRIVTAEKDPVRGKL